MYVTSADVRKYGGSEGCQACAQVYTWCRTHVPHSDACRRRIQELMKGDDRLQDLCFFSEDIVSKRLRRCRNHLGSLPENPSFTLV